MEDFNVIYCIYSFNISSDKMKVYCTVKDEEKAKEAMIHLAETFEEEQFFCESVLFYP